MYCTHCGKELPDGAMMCWRCGRAVQPLRPGEAPNRTDQASPSYEAPGGDWYQPGPASAAQTYAGPEVGPPERKNPKKLLIGISAAIVVVAVIAILIGVLAGGEPAPAAAPSQGYTTHQELIETYCGYFSSADEAGMVTLYPQALRDYLADAGYTDTAGFLYDRDEWYEDYGIPVAHWLISDVAEYAASDYKDIALDLGVSIESAVDVEVTVWFEGEDDAWLFDFDLIEIDGAWFLLSVW